LSDDEKRAASRGGMAVVLALAGAKRKKWN
jgi:hypothetical protein